MAKANDGGPVLDHIVYIKGDSGGIFPALDYMALKPGEPVKVGDNSGEIRPEIASTLVEDGVCAYCDAKGHNKSSDDKEVVKPEKAEPVAPKIVDVPQPADPTSFVAPQGS